MRLTAFLFLAACLQANAKGYSQTVTLTRTNISLVDVFQEIQRQTGYNFLYTYEELERAGPVNVDLQNVSLREAVESCLHDKPLTYTILEKTVVIKPKPIPPPAAEVPPPPVIFRGRVTDSVGEPLVGASVTVKGTKTGTKTNVKGEFELDNLPVGTVLVISYTGYGSKEITATSDLNTQTFIFLRRSQDILDATVIQAYGTTSRRFSVGSIATVDAGTIEKQPVADVLLALEGQVPGLAITATNGVPGSQVLVQVRGQNTLSNGSYYKPYDQPLFIVDGVPFAPQNNSISQLSTIAQASSYGGGINPQGGISAFIGINPNDIESISILKDADATSIYGTQGSNGVILITTKKGKAGKTIFNLTAFTGVNVDARNIKLMNTPQYLQLRKDAFAADSITPSNNPYDPGYAPDLTIFDQNKYTDWEKVIFGKTSNNTDVHASLSGGTYNNTFLISGGYTRSDFNFPGNFSDQRLTLHTTTHHSSTDNRLSIDFGTDFAYNQNNSVSFGANQKVLLPPNLPNLLDASGNLVWNYQGVNLSNDNFYASLKQPAQSNNYNLNNSLRIAYKIIPGLNISVNLGYSRNTTDDHAEMPAASQYPAYANANATFASIAFQTINVEPVLDYSTTIGKGVLTALVGGTYKKNTTNSTETEGYGYANDDFLGSINGAAHVFSNDKEGIYRYSAGFSRLKYVYNQKYIISLTGRRDGSSNFGPGHQFGNFGSAGAGWIFSEEKAFKAALPVISYAKLSGNYGTSGSDGIAAYQYQAFWQPLGYAPAFQGIQPDFPVNLYNPNYGWDLKKSLNLGLDFGFFHDRLLVNATWYRDREGHQLAGYPLPAQVGISSVLENVNSTIQNAGWEFSLTSSNIKTKNFSWSTIFNITFNRNKLLSFPNLATSSYAGQFVVGKPVSEIQGFKFAGLNTTTGLYQYYTAAGKVTSNPQYGLPSQGGDLQPITDREVKYMGGFGNTFTYKQFSVYVFFQFSSQTAPNWLNSLYGNYTPGLNLDNAPVQALNYWKNPGDHTLLQRLTTSYGTDAFTAASNFSSSSGAYGDDTYMRLKTLAVSYSFSPAVLKRMHVQGCKIYVNAQNLLTFTDYKVSDPETFNDYTAFPLQRIVVCGLSFNF